MFGNAVSGKNFSFLEGVKGGHHQISHRENRTENLEQYKRINIWHIRQYAYMLERLRSIKEGEGTLLDNSMIMFGAGMRDGNKLDPPIFPWYWPAAQVELSPPDETSCTTRERLRVIFIARCFPASALLSNDWRTARRGQRLAGKLQ